MLLMYRKEHLNYYSKIYYEVDFKIYCEKHTPSWIIIPISGLCGQ